MGRAALLVDIETVGRDAQGNDLGAQLIEGERRDLVGGAMGAVDDDAQAVQGQVARKSGLGDLDIAGLGVIDARHAAKVRWRGQIILQALVHQGLDLAFALVRQLVAVRPEQLDAVVGRRIVRGRNHDPQIRPHRARHHRHRRGRQGAEQTHIHADRGEARHQGRLDHIARQTRILADHHQMPPIRIAPEQLARRQPDPQRHFGRHRMGIGAAANAVGSEIAALGLGLGHDPSVRRAGSSLCLPLQQRRPEGNRRPPYKWFGFRAQVAKRGLSRAKLLPIPCASLPGADA